MSQSHARILGAKLAASIVSDLDLEGQRQVLDLALDLAGGIDVEVSDQLDAWNRAYREWAKTPEAAARAHLVGRGQFSKGRSHLARFQRAVQHLSVWIVALLVMATPAFAQRTIPEPPPGETFASVVEQGPAAALDTHVLTRSAIAWGCPAWINPYDGMPPGSLAALCFQASNVPPDDFLWYQRETGQYWLVVQVPNAPDCIRAGQFAPHLTLTVIDVDGDGQDDVLGHDPAPGLVYRYYLRDFGACAVSHYVQ